MHYMSFYIIWISISCLVMNNSFGRPHSYMMDTLCALTIVFPSVALCLLSLHVYHSGDTLDYLDCAMTSTPSNYKSVNDIRFHGDEDFDPRSDLSQGRGDDAEHPK